MPGKFSTGSSRRVGMFTSFAVQDNPSNKMTNPGQFYVSSNGYYGFQPVPIASENVLQQSDMEVETDDTRVITVNRKRTADDAMVISVNDCKRFRDAEEENKSNMLFSEQTVKSGLLDIERDLSTSTTHDLTLTERLLWETHGVTFGQLNVECLL